MWPRNVNQRVQLQDARVVTKLDSAKNGASCAQTGTNCLGMAMYPERVYPERVEEKVYFTIDIKLLRALLYLTLISGLFDEQTGSMTR